VAEGRQAAGARQFPGEEEFTQTILQEHSSNECPDVSDPLEMYRILSNLLRNPECIDFLRHFDHHLDVIFCAIHAKFSFST
jgi:hypothetical protein